MFPAWIGYIVHGPEHRSFLPTDHELSHKLSIVSPLEIPARRFAQDGTPNCITYTIKKKRTLKLNHNTKYPSIRFRSNNWSIHRLVALLWGAPNNTGYPMTAITFGLFEVDHIDGDKLNWDIDNLQWVLSTQNRQLYQAMRQKKQL